MYMLINFYMNTYHWVFHENVRTSEISGGLVGAGLG